jgi:RHS repeat-associated protein
VYGPGIDMPVRMQLGSGVGNKFFYARRIPGSITALTDDTGNLVESYDYKVFGETRIFDNSGTDITVASNGLGNQGNPYMYHGRRKEENGLYFFRARYLDTALGRFLQKDPKGDFAGSNLGNGQAFCGNNPVNRIDPFGLEDIQNPWTIKVPKFKNAGTKSMHALGTYIGLFDKLGVPTSLLKNIIYVVHRGRVKIVGTEAGYDFSSLTIAFGFLHLNWIINVPNVELKAICEKGQIGLTTAIKLGGFYNEAWHAFYNSVLKDSKLHSWLLDYLKSSGKKIWGKSDKWEAMVDETMSSLMDLFAQRYLNSKLRKSKIMLRYPKKPTKDNCPTPNHNTRGEQFFGEPLANTVISEDLWYLGLGLFIHGAKHFESKKDPWKAAITAGKKAAGL